MLITVTTSSQTLEEILTDAQKQQIVGARDAGFRRQLAIQILGAQDVYYEINADAAVAGGMKLIQNERESFDLSEIGDVNLIADGANNTDVRLTVH